jgi:AcrR family transcriptional regulator
LVIPDRQVINKEKEHRSDLYGTLFRLSRKLIMRKQGASSKGEQKTHGDTRRAVRADARRNLDALLRAAMAVFAVSGVDAPVREIAEKAGVGLGTVYRHFPRRSDLIVAVLQTQIDACAGAARDLATKHEPGEALARWMQRYMDLIATKRGFAGALHSGDLAYSALSPYFFERMEPALHTLLDKAAAAGTVRSGVKATDLLRAVATLCHGPHGEEPLYARKMVELLVDGLRYGATKQFAQNPK